MVCSTTCVGRLGPDRVHVLLIGSDGRRPETPYACIVVPRPGADRAGRAPCSPGRCCRRFSPFQEAALWSRLVRRDLARTSGRDRRRPGDLGHDANGPVRRDLPRRGRRVLYADDLFSKRYASMRERIRTDPARVGNPLGEFGKMLPGWPAGWRRRRWSTGRCCGLEQHLTARSEDASAGRLRRHHPGQSRPRPGELARRSGSNTVRTLLPLLREPARAEHVASTAPRPSSFSAVWTSRPTGTV